MIKLNTTYKWIPADLFYKINTITFWENWKDEQWKVYQALVLLYTYSDINKINYVEPKELIIANLRLNELNLETAYNKIKELEEFIWCEDC